MAAAITKTVHLYSPTNKKTVDGLVVSPYQNIEQVLQGVRLAFSVKYAALYTVDAKPIASVETLHDDQRVLVAVTPSERMLPDAPEEFVLYNGEEGDEVSPDVEGSEQAWEVSHFPIRILVTLTDLRTSLNAKRATISPT